ncbi:MAG: hypothetical protein MPI95_08435, partial [Nitrosopumilus sp.]|nr:hypothetical protein [Nitrosopumilus sp.]CAI9832217.1 hypothetical protein IBTHAUMO2_620020 [Nitrosopumilaceae archaeon]MDA7945518.1 hypothetical protein [Nitrosopumilus sp.]MDA7955464.1 hypothetical protein [Nitrosopumilus sp.]MDA7959087.1 hypothetical protein [Nitrosopumilus sp.]
MADRLLIAVIIGVGGMAAFGIQLAYSNSGDIEGITTSIEYLREDVREIKDTVNRLYENQIKLSANQKLLCDKLEVDCI